MTSYLLMNINELGAVAMSSQVYIVRSLLRLSFYKILLENPNRNESMTSYLLMNINYLDAMAISSRV